jgi:hypothetical protein
MSKILKYPFICFAVLLLAMPVKADGLDISIETGFSVVLQQGDRNARFMHIPFVASIGYSLGPYRISLEGLASFPLVCYYASAIFSFTFASNDFVRGYVLAGLGYGDTYYFQKRGLEGDIDGSGLIQAQAGIGVGFKLNNWLELGIDSRARIGFPDNPDAVTVTQHVWIMFKL